MQSAKRYLLSASVAFGVTFGLILIMHHAVKVQDVEVIERPLTNLLNALPVLDEHDVPPKRERVKKPEKPNVEPQTELPRLATTGFGEGLEVAPTKHEPGLIKTTGYADGEALPIMTVPPEYPQRMLSRGVEGWVLVEFTVDELGRVIEPRVIDAQPANGFNQAALRAVLRYKYKPQVVDGQAVQVPGLRQRIVFSVAI